MKKVLIIIAGKEASNRTWEGFFSSVKKQLNDDIRADWAYFYDLVFDVSNDKCQILNTKTGKDVSENDFVVIRNVGKRAEAGITLANYLKSKNVSFSDSYLGDTLGSGKLACSMMRIINNLPVPRTIYADNPNLLLDYIEKSDLNFPVILKDDCGKKGRDNYLIKSIKELEEKLLQSPTIHFVVQEFISNDGDYRVLVMGGKVEAVIKRVAQDGSHLNNTSQGGNAFIEPVSIFSDAVIADVLKSAEVEKLEVAGVDIVFEKESGKHYFLEVNRAPQLSSGSFVEEKVMAYANFINRDLK